MSDFSNQLIVPESRPLDPAILHILTVVDTISSEQMCPYLVIGATARDLLLYHVFGIPTTRATRDVDFAIAAEDWNVFSKLRAALLATGNFKTDRAEHRLLLKAPRGATDIPIDLIPFGGVAENDMISWPPQGETAMIVAGFEDAFLAAVRVQVAPKVSVPLVSLAGLAILKIFAWQDRQATDKDALDLYRLITTYADAGNTDRLYDSEPALLDESGFDLEIAGAALLGRDAGRIASRSTLDRLRALLTQVTFVDRLTDRIRTSRWPFEPEQANRIHTLLSTFNAHILRQ
jgi:predicted nucleotidyltransferase